MKLIEKIILVIYSIIMLILSFVFCLLIFRFVNVDIINNFIFQILNNYILSIITVIISVIFILMSIKCIFFLSKKSDYYKDNISLKNEEGKLVITKVTIENIVNNVINGFQNMKDANIKVKFDKQNNIVVNLEVFASENADMQELTQNIRNKIKNTIKKSSGLIVKEINVKIKNIQTEKNIIQE